jgi:cytochrome c-type biogenesis protein CcsB
MLHLPPELQAKSPWLLLHIPLLFMAYLLLAVASGTGILFLIEERLMKSRHLTNFAWNLPSLESMDAFIHRLIVWAFPMLSVGILLGAHWAYQAWGRFWAWDPKETFSLITWSVYLLFLVTRWAKGWRGRKSTYLSLVGFVLVLITFIAVSFMRSKHNFN